MWISLAWATPFTIADTRYQIDHERLQVADVELLASGYGYALKHAESCIGIAVEGRSSAQLPDGPRKRTWHDVEHLLVFDSEVCGLLKVENPVEDSGDVEEVVVRSKRRDRSLARLRRALAERVSWLADRGLDPELLQPGQRLVEVRHRDGTGRVESKNTTGWSTLIEDPFQQVEFGIQNLVLESSKHGEAKAVYRRAGTRSGVRVDETTLNMQAIDFGITHKVEFHARMQVRCVHAPCSHVSLLLPATYEEQTVIASYAPAFTLSGVEVDGHAVVVQDDAFGRSAAHSPLAYQPITVPLALEPGGAAVVDLRWKDRWFLSHEIPKPVFSDSAEVSEYLAFSRERPGPERTWSLDLSRDHTHDVLHRESAAALIPGVDWVAEVRDTGMRPRTVMPVVVGQARPPRNEARLIRPSTGLPVWLHGAELQVPAERMHIATSTHGGPWVGAGRYKTPEHDGGVSIYLSSPDLRAQGSEVSSRLRALHELLSAELGARPLDLALFEGPRLAGMRPGYGATSGMAWIRPTSIPSGVTEDGSGNDDTVRAAQRRTFPNATDRALVYAVAKQWFDRPAATLEPWLEDALTEMYADLLFEAVHGAASATSWRRHPDPFEQKRFADFGIHDWSHEQQVAYAARALELVRTSIGPSYFNQAVRAMLQTDEALSADLLARHFVQAQDQTLVRDALMEGLCPDVRVTWQQERLGRGKVEVVSPYTDAPLVVPVVIEAKGTAKQQYFVKLEDGRGSLDLSARLNIKRVHVDPYARLPLCGTEVVRL